MTLKDLESQIDFEVYCKSQSFDKKLNGGYVGDLLSDVMANAQVDSIWITIQIHPNIIAVAVLKELSAIIIAGGREPQEATLEKAREEDITVMGCKISAYELVGKLNELGLHRTS